MKDIKKDIRRCLDSLIWLPDLGSNQGQ
ncbi:uncharacterized protein METZ01_LOCUS264283, partial [marine metagenome]